MAKVRDGDGDEQDDGVEVGVTRGARSDHRGPAFEVQMAGPWGPQTSSARSASNEGRSGRDLASRRSPEIARAGALHLVSMGHDTKSKGADEPSAELQQRAMLTAQRAADLAATGFPSYDQLVARTGKFFARVDHKLADVPQDRRQPPPATIAAPAAWHYVLLGDGPEVADLREFFENLLASAMDRDTASDAHPAFVSMISQLTPDEARILKSIDRRRYAALNLFEATPEGAALTESLIGFRSLLGLDTGIDESRQQQYLSNLSRLSIIRFDWGDSLHSTSERKELERRVNSEFPMRNLSIFSGTISITVLGRQFLDACVRPRAR